MTLTTAERQLAALYYCGGNISTAAIIREALPDIFCPDTRAAALGVIRKLEAMDGSEFEALLEGGMLLCLIKKQRRTVSRFAQ